MGISEAKRQELLRKHEASKLQFPSLPDTAVTEVYPRGEEGKELSQLTPEQIEMYTV